MLRQGAQHALLLCAEACWLAPNTMPWMHCSTPCWLVQCWDHDGSGYISSEEFVAPGTGLLDYARKYLLRETPAPAVAVAMIY